MRLAILGAFRGDRPEAILQIKFLASGEGDLAGALGRYQGELQRNAHLGT
jgi:hypothetical protein